MTKEQIIEYLATAPLEDTLDIIHETLRRIDVGNAVVFPAKVFLGLAYQEEGQLGSDDWTLSAVALVDSEVYPSGRIYQSTLSDYGVCPKCKTHLTSPTTHCLCPICNSKAFAT